MKKLIVAALLIFLFLIILLVVGFGYVYMNRGELIRKGTEKALEFTLMVDVDVQSADLNVQEQTVEINGIEIDNPEGYDTEHAMRFGKILVQVDLQSFRTEVPRIREIRVEDSDVILEAKVGGKTNMQVLMDNAQRFQRAEEPPEEAQKKYKIDNIYVNGFTTSVALPLSGGKTVDVQVPDIHMQDVGGDKEAVTPGEAMREFIAVLLEKITEMGKGIIPPDLLNNISGTLQNLPGDLKENLSGAFKSFGETGTGLKDSLNDAGKNLEGAAEGTRKSVEDAAKDVEGAFKGLLGGKKEE